MSQIDIKQPTLARALADSRNGVGRYEIADSRAKGLRLRVSPGAVLWQYRFMMDKKPTRLTLGSVDTWSIAEARQLVSDASVLIRGRIRRPDDAWVAEQLVAHGKASAPADEPVLAAHPNTWEWVHARELYIEDTFRTKRKKTADSYRTLLTNTPELAQLHGRLVSSISRREAARVIAEIHWRVEPHAEHVAAVVSAFYTWLGDDARADETGVEPGHMRGLKAPARTAKAEVAKPAFNRKRYAPPMHEVGRLMAIAKSGAIDDRIALAIQHLVYTVQRVTYIVHARVDGMVAADTIGEGLWIMEPMHRKTAERRDDNTDHIVPLPKSAWSVVSKAMDLTEDMDHHRVFPGYRPRKKGGPVDAINESAVQHNISYMPGVIARPHDLRRSFAKFGQSKFQWGIEGTRSILDHNEGFSSDDVTVRSYLHDGIGPKWDIMRNWCGFVDEATAEALDYDKRLHDVEWLHSTIARNRDEIKDRYRQAQGKPPRRTGASLAKPGIAA